MNKKVLTLEQAQAAANLIEFEESCSTCVCGDEHLHPTYRHCTTCSEPNPQFDEALMLYHAHAKQHAISRAGLDCSNHASEGFKLGIRIGWRRCPECTAHLTPVTAAA